MGNDRIVPVTLALHNSRGGLAEFTEKLEQLVRLDGLDEVAIEERTGFGLRCVSGQGNEREWPLVAHLAGNGIPVELWQTDVEESHVRVVVADQLQSGGAVVSQLDIVASVPQEDLQAPSRIDVVIHDQDATTLAPLVATMPAESAFVSGPDGAAGLLAPPRSSGRRTRNSLPFPAPSLLASMVPP